MIASHSSAFAICPHPRNVPDDMLARVRDNGGVVMVNFYTGFVNPEASRMTREARETLKAEHPDDPAAYRKALSAWYDANPIPRADAGPGG